MEIGNSPNRVNDTEMTQNIAASPRREDGNGAARHPQTGRPPLSPQQEERKRRALAMRRRRKEALIARLTLCLAVYAACCLIITGFVFSLYRTSGGKATSLTVKDSDGKALCRLSPNEFNVNGAEYISASALSKLYSFTLAGDREKVNMYFFSSPQETREEAQDSKATDDESADEAPLKKPETGAVRAESETVRLFKDSSLLEINGESTRLGAKIIFTDDYYIPLELIENYFNGAIIERDGGKVTLSRNEDARFTLRLHDPRS